MFVVGKGCLMRRHSVQVFPEYMPKRLVELSRTGATHSI